MRTEVGSRRSNPPGLLLVSGSRGSAARALKALLFPSVLHTLTPSPHTGSSTSSEDPVLVPCSPQGSPLLLLPGDP